MYFRLMYHVAKGEYHARLYNSDREIVMWTRYSRSRQEILSICENVQREGVGLHTPIYEASY